MLTTNHSMCDVHHCICRPSLDRCHDRDVCTADTIFFFETLRNGSGIVCGSSDLAVTMAEMTKKAINDLIKKYDLYSTPELNDKLYLNHKGLRSFD